MENQKQFKTPIILSSEPARQKYQDNLLKLQGFESQYANVQPVQKSAEKPEKPVNFQ